MKDIITVTVNPSVDKSADIEQMKSDTKLRCRAVRTDPGGGGINVSRALKKMGGTSKAFYLSGGSEGEKLKKLLSEEELIHENIQINGTSRENLTVFEESTGNQYRFGMPGPEINADELENAINTIMSAIDDNSILAASGSLPESVPDNFYRQLADKASDAGALTVLDTSGQALAEALESGKLFLIKPNLRELSQLQKSGEMEMPEILKASMQIIDSGRAMNVVVSLGAGGACLVNNDVKLKYDSPTVPVNSRIGAGDSMTAGIIKSLAAGSDIRDAVKLGVAAGAAAVITPGTVLCRAEDVERLYKHINITEL